MASCSGTETTSSGGSYPIQISGTDEDLQRLMDQRKRKRMVSNRESARRSRIRNNQVMANVSITMQHYTSVGAENLVLRAQVAELSHRLESLNQIMAFMDQPINAGCGFVEEQYEVGGTELIDEFMDNSLSCFYANQPILASADMIQYRRFTGDDEQCSCTLLKAKCTSR